MMTLLLPGLARRRARTQACRVDMTLDDILLDALGDRVSPTALRRPDRQPLRKARKPRPPSARLARILRASAGRRPSSARSPAIVMLSTCRHRGPGQTDVRCGSARSSESRVLGPCQP